MTDMWYLYIVEFNNGKQLYTGITIDIERRIYQHNVGVGAKSLRGKGPIVLKYFENFNSQTDAARREREIKGWNRNKKLKLIEQGLSR